MESGKRLRFDRLMDRSDVHHESGVHRRAGSLFLVPLDHSVAHGPLTTSDGLAGIIESVGRNGADGVVVHKGRVRFLNSLGPHLALVVHLSATPFSSTAGCPVRDRSTATSMRGLAKALGDGAMPAEAVRLARARARKRRLPASVWAAFVVSGA